MFCPIDTSSSFVASLDEVAAYFESSRCNTEKFTEAVSSVVTSSAGTEKPAGTISSAWQRVWNDDFRSNSTYSICCGFAVQQAVRLVVKLWICCGVVVQLFDLSYSFSICCGFVESYTPLIRFAVDLL
jgi:hypothetical protein